MAGSSMEAALEGTGTRAGEAGEPALWPVLNSWLCLSCSPNASAQPFLCLPQMPLERGDSWP